MATKKVSRRRAAADDVAAPLKFEEISRVFRSRKAGKAADQMLELSFFVAGKGPSVKVISNQQGENYKVDLQIRGSIIGQHSFPPAIKTLRLAAGRTLMDPGANAQVLSAYAPDHLDLRTIPQKLGKKLAAPPRIDALRKLKKGENQATTVFNPENRYIFNDTAYPWSSAGRVDTPNGTGSGVMIGPRHLLTCSHVIQWLPGNTAGWVKFTPSYFNGSAPFGIAWGTLIYWDAVKVTPPTISWSEGQHDYVCVVLDRRIGDLTGWMGSRGYTDSWDGGQYWSHIGYPGDLSSSERPSFEGSIALDGTSQPDEHQNILHRGDVWPGQSGGPFFGWWSGDVGPRAVSVQSWQNSSDNGASGGQHMVDLVIRARNENP